MHRTRVWALITTASATTFGLAACGDEVTAPLAPVPPIEATGGSGGTGGSSTGGMGGTEAPTDRGDPATFPTTCTESCEAACARLDECDGENAVEFPLARQECVQRCALAQNGPIWDDVSGNFLCCTAQDSCDLVKNCGGWLEHPAVENSCDKLCECFFGTALEPLREGHAAPPAYRFADDTLLLQVDATLSPAALPGGMRLIRRVGPWAQLRLRPETTPQDIAALAAFGRVLPTFYDAAGRLSAASGRVIVDVRKPGAETALKSTLTAWKLATTTPRFASHLRVVEVPDPWLALDLREQLVTQGMHAELDQVRSYSRRYVPSDPLFGDQWHLFNSGQRESTPGVDARVSEAWDVTQGASSVIVAINDDGVDITHPDFAGRLEPELNFDADWESALAMGTYGNHGSSVAGVATAGIDDAGGAGACPACRVLPHQLGPSDFGGFQLTDMDVADGFTAQVEAGAAVINNSWGFSTGNPTYVSSTLPVGMMPVIVSAALDNAESAGRGGLGTIVVFAAGNDNGPLDYYGTHPNVVAVGAIGNLGTKSYYSSFGDTVDVAAPSNGALSGITTTQAGGGHTDSFGGTSSAAPLVSGIIGLILSAEPTLTAAEVRQILIDSSTKIDPVYGEYDNEGFSPFYGAGMIDAYHAVQLATGDCTAGSPCVAPTDDCGGTCGTGVECSVCRTQDDCATGFVCQALSSLGAQVCVAEKGVDPCAAGTTEVNGHCLPSPTTCNLCQATEACNGRDDDCDGEVDEEGVCGGPARCFVDGPGCSAGTVCAGIQCVDECSDDDECAEGQSCEVVKDQYGASAASVRGCIASQASLCVVGCSVLASSTDDATIDEFTGCMQDGEASCNAAFPCAGTLPINAP